MDGSGKVVFVGYWKDGKKNGMIYVLDENGKAKRGYLYENDTMKRVVIEFMGSEMVEYDRNGKKVYEGGYGGDSVNGFVREGKGYCYEGNGSDMKYCVYGGGSVIRVIVEIKGSVMTEYDNNGKKKYVGGFKGDRKNGFVRNGEGKEMDEKGKIGRAHV